MRIGPGWDEWDERVDFVVVNECVKVVTIGHIRVTEPALQRGSRQSLMLRAERTVIAQ